MIKHVIVACCLTVAALLPPAAGVLLASSAMLSPALGREEVRQLGGALGGASRAELLSPERQTYELGGEVARELDARHLQDGSVLIDVATGFPVVLRSSNPRQFVITPDRNFEAAVADPASFGIQYIVIPARSSLGALDAISRRHPLLYSNGDGIAQLLREFDSDAGMTWRLYRVKPSN